MKYEKVIIESMPRSFRISGILSLLYHEMPENPYCRKYGLRKIESDSLDNSETFFFAYREGLSATGIALLHNSMLNTLTFMVPGYASEADVLLFATLVNAILRKHPRTKAFDDIGRPVKAVTGQDVDWMNRDRACLLQRNLQTMEGFTMQGLNHSYILKVEHLIPYSSVEMKAFELKQTFINIQWESPEEE